MVRSTQQIIAEPWMQNNQRVMAVVSG